ncbi:hypothetical protein A3A67_05410 [Candidatus Peribacteria bacterium RIFCSPLOWO2_01_FULL_51_18]|nr:MAG: hypothetical protein A3C52_00350 [Candidatus Peribacteria bacterium RIFCSPHIGHO2_02_FULL_51_15]OGJ66366.1 MAG: hypothetical protein A3A67_05410 [Candidatus Peribacteria bacterium RIFCSPLOWO2_01_FULL_51_18]OGJ67831.1 MAG: hypothetical protein A3J34_01640 [Candidatus Peribacteria bacterium RIFCSPLOWO2_02_FULL_51_10]
MSQEDIRFRQRFQNYHRAFGFLRTIVALPPKTDIERAALIQAFELTFELAWKLLKDELAMQGQVIPSPRDVIKQAFQNRAIANGEAWLRALQDRNNTTHIYDEETSKAVSARITGEYFPLLEDLHRRLLPLLK